MTRKCTECGCTDIEVDTARADAVCTGCGAVLESSIIVSDIQFEENAHGGSSAIGTFVSNESKGGKLLGGSGANYVSGIGRESREVTLKNARKKIVALAQQLRLRPDHIDMAFYFFKLALSKHLTRGRKSSHVIAACVYITCRTEGTSHMLIDFSDILQIDVYELGRTYLRLSQALCINIPAMDPCLYVMRFAHRLEFGDKTHEVSMTALRLVSRMKKDWIHFGRRPSGLCGAALLIAARLHEFSRSIIDVIKVVKVHESTLRKRLSEFGETPASQLTLDEFMTVDLDAMTEEQDPPSFKAARRRDRERLAMLDQEEDLEKEMTKLEALIEKELEERKGKLRGPYAKFANQSSEDSFSNSPSSIASESGESEGEETEEAMTARFLTEETLSVINTCVVDGKEVSKEITSKAELDSLLMPPPSSTPVRATSSSVNSPRNSVISPGMGLRNSVEDYLTNSPKDANTKDQDMESEQDEELDLTGIDDDEIDSYIMSTDEIKLKTRLWLKLNADYLLEQEEKLKREKLEREELIKQGKDPDKKRRAKRKPRMSHINNGSALEAIEKIVQEKKISTKINYDVLRSLNMSTDKSSSDSEQKVKSQVTPNCDAAEPAAKRLKTENSETSAVGSRVTPLAADTASTAKSVSARPARAIPILNRARNRAKVNLASVKSSSASRRSVNLSAFITKSKKSGQDDENSRTDTSDRDSDALTTSDRDNSDVDTCDKAEEALSWTEEKSDMMAGSQDSGIGTQGSQASSSQLSSTQFSPKKLSSDNNNDLDDSFEGEESDQVGGDSDNLGVAELLNRHMGNSQDGGYSDMEEDYY